jgi:hypothetical protein
MINNKSTLTKILFSALIIFFIGCSKKCPKKLDKINIDRNYYNLKGNVQYFSEIDESQNGTYGFAKLFNEQGNILADCKLKNKENLEFVKDEIYEYNDKGQLSKKIKENELIEFQFDNFGNQISELRYENNLLIEKRTNTYNNRNLCIKESNFFTTKVMTDAFQHEYTYDECDNLIMTKTNTSNLTKNYPLMLTNKVYKYEYDNQGNRIKTTIVYDEKSTEIETKKFDNNNNVVEFNRIIDDKLIEVGKYKYDDLGRVIEFIGSERKYQINYENDKKDYTINYFSTDVNKPYGTEKYIYTLDSFGNWTSEIKITNGQIENTKKRIIKYF